MSNHVVEGYGRHLKGSMVPMVNLGIHEFTDYETGIFTLEEYFMNVYVEEVYGLEHVCTSTEQLRIILGTKYERANLNKVVKNLCQHLTEMQRNSILNLLQNF